LPILSTSLQKPNANIPKEDGQEVIPIEVEIGRTFNNPNYIPITEKLYNAFKNKEHPKESQSELGNGVFLTDDWRKTWYNYQSPADDPMLISEKNGYAEYDITDDMIEGVIPNDLVGTLYRNGPGNFGFGNERIVHALDADGLIIQVSFPHVNDHGSKRRIQFKSKFIETTGYLKEKDANKFLCRGTFGTAPRGPLSPPLKRGLNEDPSPPPNKLSSMIANAFKTDIKNTANTHVISFGGKLLALFEAGLPYRIDPATLNTIGEDDMSGTLIKDKPPVKLPNIPKELQPPFFGGAAHTAHPHICPRTKHLVGFSWSSLIGKSTLEISFSEWSPANFSLVASKTYELQSSLAPHDIAITENAIIVLVNSLSLDTMSFLSGMQGPAASLKMDGMAQVTAHVYPRPCATKTFEPFQVDVPPNFSIHFSHAYENESNGNIVTYFSGWPPSNSKDFLGAWGGFAPEFQKISQTFLWKLEIDPKKKSSNLSVAPNSLNVCAEHPVIHPSYATKRAKNVFVVVSNLVGDSSAPCGYANLRVEDNNDDGRPKEGSLFTGERNNNVDAYFFGTRYFAGEPLVVPKNTNDDNPKEEEAYLLGVVFDAVKEKSFLAIFDLERDLKRGPVAKIWFRSHIPHGLHGCFAVNGNDDDYSGDSCYFC